MSIDPRHLHLCVVRPTLEAMAAAEPRMAGPAAEALLMGTAAVESGLGTYLRQVVGGEPAGTARGVWQVEPATGDDLLVRWLDRPENRTLRYVIMRSAPRDAMERRTRLVEALTFDLRLCCAVARLRYWTSPGALPDPDDVEGQARYWVENYNRGGAGTVERYVEAWHRHLGAWAAEERRRKVLG